MKSRISKKSPHALTREDFTAMAKVLAFVVGILLTHYGVKHLFDPSMPVAVSIEEYYSNAENS